MNELILLIEIIVTFFALIMANKLYGKNGLYFWLIIFIIASTILSVKTVIIFKYEVSLGIVPYVSNFICMNILVQKYGTEQNRKIVICSIMSLIFSYFLILILNNCSIDYINLENNEAFINVFKLDIIKCIAFVIAYIASILANIELYYQIRKTKNKIWISNLISTIIIQFTDTVLYSIIAYLVFADIKFFVFSIIITTIIKYIVGIIGTGAIYICKKIED